MNFKALLQIIECKHKSKTTSVMDLLIYTFITSSYVGTATTHARNEQRFERLLQIIDTRLGRSKISVSVVMLLASMFYGE